MKVFVINTVVLNTGDSAILHGLIETVREAFGPAVRITVFDAHAAAARTLYPGIDLRRPPWQVVTGDRPVRGRGLAAKVLARASRTLNIVRFRAAFRAWRGALRALASRLLTPDERLMIEEFSTADLVISTGGTYLVEQYVLVPRWFDIDLVIDLGRPLVLFTQSLGPFRSVVNRDRMRRAAAGSRVVLLRDPASRDNLREIGVSDDKLVVAADAAFAVARPAGPSTVRHPSGSPMRVAISVREWRWFAGGSASDGMARFKAALVDVTRHLVEHLGAEVTFVSTCQGVPAYAMDDSKTADEIAHALPPSICARVVVDRAFHTPQALAAMLSAFDLVIATRMHFAILAMIAGTPAVAIAYESKTKELYAGMNLGRLVDDIESVTAQSLIAKVEWAIEHRAELEATIGDAVSRAHADARSVAALLRERYTPPGFVTTAT